MPAIGSQSYVFCLPAVSACFLTRRAGVISCSQFMVVSGLGVLPLRFRTQTFDNAGEVTGQSPISGSGGSSSIYSYDTLGDQSSAVSGSTTTTEGYNQLGQMASTTTSSTGSTYLYTGDGLEAARYAAPTWGTTTDIDSTKALYSVSCPTISFCAAVDKSGRVLTYNGSSWSAASTIGSVRINSVSCPSTSFCEAVDNSGNAFKYNGTSWTETTGIDGTNVLNSVSCPSTSFCMAVDNSGDALSFNGTSWSSATSIDSTKPINGVSCSSSSFCVAVANTGKDVIYTGTWGSATTIDGTTMLEAVSCPTSSFCEAVDGAGNALKYNGASWSSATSIDGSKVIDSVSCTVSGLCAAVDASGDGLTYRNSTWSPATDIDGSNTLEAVSCVNFAVCAAVDGSGNAQWFKGAENAQLVWDSNGSLPQILTDGTNDYIYGPNNEPVEQVNLSSSTPTYLTYTPSDSSRLATNNAGQQVAFWRYDAFGNLATGTPDSPFGYSGQYTDASTGLVNDRARFYESQTGSFTTRDPAFSATDQAYAYADGDAVNRSDPSGDNALSGPAVSDGCNGSNHATCEQAWNQSSSDILQLQDQEFPGFNWHDEFTSALQGAGEGAAAGALTGCLAGLPAAGIGCIPGAIGGGVSGLVGGLVGGVISGVTNQDSFVNAQYISNFLDASLNLIFVDTYPYISPYREDCSNNVDCVDATVLQNTTEFQHVLKKMYGVFGSTTVVKVWANLTIYLAKQRG